MDRRSVTFAILVVVVLIAVAMLTTPPRNTAFTSKDAVDASLKDAQQFAAVGYPGAETYIEVTSASNASGKWKVEMRLSIAPHSRCPAMQKLYYEMFPVTLRNETVVAANDCHARPISVAPDAIVDSYADSAGARQAQSIGYAACAFQIPLSDVAAATNYCPAVDNASIADFASSNALKDGSWVVQWYRKASDSYLVALDSSGSLLAEGNYAPRT